MRTIAVNAGSSRKKSALGKLPVQNVESGGVKRKSCFYELGAKNTIGFRGYSDKPASSLVKKIRERPV